MWSGEFRNQVDMREGEPMETTTINATELRVQTRDILERARFKGERFMIQTFGRPVAVIMGIEEYRILVHAMKKARRTFNGKRALRRKQR